MADILVKNGDNWDIYDQENGGSITEDYNCFGASPDYFSHAKGANSIESDPKFVDVANRVFILQSDSPCIEKGTNVGIRQDFYGTHIPQGLNPDIGAVEYVVRQDPTEYSSGFGF